MNGWLSVERIADTILMVMLAEAGLLLWQHRRGRSALSPVAVGLLLLPGALLVAALRLSSSLPESWPALLLCLGAAFGAHIVDLRQRSSAAEIATRAPPPPSKESIKLSET